MKILFISRSTLFKDKGGDTVQLMNTASWLRKLNIEVDVRLCHEEIDYTGYRLIHFFNIIRPADILIHIRRSGLPYVVSTIYVDYSEYEKKARRGIAGLIFRLFAADFIEYVKVIARWLLNGEKIISPEYIFLGQKRSVRKIIQGASILLPNSHSEYKRLVKHFRINHCYKVIPNAIDPALFSSSDKSRDPRVVICVGRIEGRKNQLNLIRALNGLSYKLIIIGSPSANQVKYFETCKKEAGANVSFISNIPQEELLAYYKIAKVHVLPSWFETTGLSSLEAAAMGCNIVITDKGDTREYFENYAYYCDPASPESIFAAIERAAAAAPGNGLRKKILSRYTWAETAAKTVEAYEETTRNNQL